jgi:hypothetical protein
LKYIPLYGKRGAGKFALVDDDDFERVLKIRWNINKNGYVYNKSHNVLIMSRFILNINDPKILVDHIDHNKLNNQKENLRLANKAENNRNKLISSTKTSSKFKGVFKLDNFKYLASIGYNYKQIHIGIFSTEEDAARAYNRRAKELFGEFAHFNDVSGWDTFSIDDHKCIPSRSSSYKGVVYDKSRNLWISRIYFNGDDISIGRFRTENDAAVAYNNFIINNKISNKQMNNVT